MQNFQPLNGILQNTIGLIIFFANLDRKITSRIKIYEVKVFIMTNLL